MRSSGALRIWLPIMLLSTPLPSHAAGAAVDYDAGRNCIRVVGYPEDSPATMATLLAADQRHGWDRIRYDAGTDTYYVDAAIWIGDDRSDGTFLQIGDAEHPRVTVVVKGTVWVRPPKETAPRSDGLPRVMNRLALGAPQDAGIRATLKFDCERPGQHGLYVGFRPRDSKTILRRGALHVYNSTITAATQDKQHAWGTRDYTNAGPEPRWARPGWYASDVRLISATLSWFEGCVTYGFHSGALMRTGRGGVVASSMFIIKDTTFEHGGVAVQNGTQYMEGCTLRHLDIAVAEGGALAAKLVNCTLEHNRLNWTLGSIFSRGIVMLDCDAGPPTEPATIRKNRIDANRAARQGVDVYPIVRQRKTLQVRVEDAAGQPVPTAMVVVTCDVAPEELTGGAMVTDEKGLTPSSGDGATVVTMRMLRATDDPSRPENRSFEYRVAVTAKGHERQEVVLPPGAEIQRPFVVRLRLAQGAKP